MMREWRSLFWTSRGFMLLGGFAGLLGFYFFNVVGRYTFLLSRAAGMELQDGVTIPSLQQFVVLRFLQFVLATFVVCIPLFCMRLFSEERRSGTFELLCTSPLSLAEVLWGKFLAAIGYVTALVGIAALYLGIVAFYGSPDVGALGTGLLGLWLSGVLFAAVAISFGVRSAHQLTVATASGSALIVVSLLHTVTAVLPGLRSFIEPLSPVIWLDIFASGVLPVAGLGFFLGASGLALSLALGLLEGERRGDASSEQGGATSQLAGVAVGWIPVALLCVATLLAVVFEELSHPLVVTHLCVAGAGLVLVAYRRIGLRASLASRRASSSQLPLWRRPTSINAVMRATTLVLLMVLALRSERYWDLSDTHQSSLSSHAEQVLSRLERPIELLYLSRRDSEQDRWAMQQLRRYTSSAVTVTFVDTPSAPALLRRIGATPRDRVVLRLRETALAGEPIVRLESIDEGALIGGIVSLTARQRKQVYLLSGYGIPSVGDQGVLGLRAFAQLLLDENLDPRPLSLSGLREVPADAELLVIAGLRNNPDSIAMEALQRYVKSGKPVLLSTDPLFANLIAPLTEPLQLQLNGALVLDRDQTIYTAGALGLQPFVTRFAAHPITAQLGRSRVVLMNIATVIEPRAHATGVIPLLFASPGSLQEANPLPILNGDSTPQFGVPDLTTELLPLGVAVTHSSGEPRAVVLGDTDLFLNGALGYYGHRELLRNATHWLLRDTWALAPRAQTADRSALVLAVPQYRWLIAATVLLLEVGALLAALWLARRYRLAC